jgi:hypothetical protein
VTFVFTIPEAYCMVPDFPNERMAFRYEAQELLEAVAKRPVTFAECQIAPAHSGVAVPRQEKK